MKHRVIDLSEFFDTYKRQSQVGDMTETAFALMFSKAVVPACVI